MKYDLIISLGQWCITSIALRKLGLQNKSYPFDWSGGIMWEKCGYGGLSGKVDLICNNFENFFDFNDFEDRGANPPNEDFWMRWVVNKRTGLQYKHDFPSDKNFKESFLDVKEKYVRRVQRLYEKIYAANRVLFVYIARDKDFSDDYLIDQHIKLQKKFPYKDIDILYIINDESISPYNFVTSYLSANIKKIILNFAYTDKTDPHEVLLGNTDLYYKILKENCLSKDDDISHLRQEFIDIHFPNINNRFGANEYNTKLLYVLNHLATYRVKKAIYAVKKAFAFGKRHEKYQAKYNNVKALIKEAKKFKKQLMKV